MWKLLSSWQHSWVAIPHNTCHWNCFHSICAVVFVFNSANISFCAHLEHAVAASSTWPLTRQQYAAVLLPTTEDTQRHRMASWQPCHEQFIHNLLSTHYHQAVYLCILVPLHPCLVQVWLRIVFFPRFSATHVPLSLYACAINISMT